jgi:histidine triad (HIT) family protein
MLSSRRRVRHSDLVTDIECVFCQFLAGDAEAMWIERGESAAALFPLPQDSLAPGHTLVISSHHVEGVHEAESAVLASVMELLQRVALGLERALAATGVNVFNASGAGSEQSVPHLHFHVVPRWPDDGWTTWPAGRSKVDLGRPSDALATAVATALTTHE